MPRLALGMLVGILVGVVVGAAFSIHAQEDEVTQLAEQVGLEVADLRGALSSQPGVDVRTYLIFLGRLPSPETSSVSGVRPLLSPAAGLSARVECIIAKESQGVPTARNPRSGAMGLGQFLPSTWDTTPYAHQSPYDPAANRAAIAWMIQTGRAREFDAVRFYGC